MEIVFIYGGPATGKYTIARQVAEATGLPLFHNHLVVDALLSTFEFGSPAFVRLRDRFWMDVFEAAVAEGRSLVFTFQPEPTVRPDFPDRVQQVFESAGGKVHFVHLTVSRQEQERRLPAADRAAFAKMRSITMLRELHDSFRACEAAMPAPSLRIDTTATAPHDAAARIARLLTDA